MWHWSAWNFAWSYMMFRVYLLTFWGGPGNPPNLKFAHPCIAGVVDCSQYSSWCSYLNVASQYLVRWLMTVSLCDVCGSWDCLVFIVFDIISTININSWSAVSLIILRSSCSPGGATLFCTTDEKEVRWFVINCSYYVPKIVEINWGVTPVISLLAGSLARVVPGPVHSRPLCFLAGSTRVAWFFRLCFFECVGFSYVVLDLVCLAILPSDWL